MMHWRFHFGLCAVHAAVSCVVLLAGSAAAQNTQPASQPSSNNAPLSPAAVLGKLITQLTLEGQQLVDGGSLPRAHPSIASEFPYELPEAQLALCLTTRQHREPLVDAYIRWQLTSFSPAIPELRPNQVQKLLDELPGLAVNPRADDELIRMMNRALEAGELSEADQETITQTLEEMGEYVSKRRALNTPALELRLWLEEQFEDNLPMRILLALERCDALVTAGWELGSHGAETERRFMEVARNREFTDDDRRIVTRAAGRIIGTSRVYVRSARIVENRLEVNFADTGLYDFEVRRWLRKMDGK